jgi:hypothetical protein
MEESKRLNLAVPAGLAKAIPAIQRRLQLPSATAVIQRAILHLDILSKTIADGGKIILEDRHGKQEVLKVL